MKLRKLPDIWASLLLLAVLSLLTNEVLFANSSKLGDSRLEHINKPGSKDTKNMKIQDMQLINEGLIKSIIIPDGWLPEKIESIWLDQGKTVIFHHPATLEAKLVFYIRPKEMSERQAQIFHQVLEQKSHDLTTEEWERLNMALGNVADEEAFRKDKAYVRELNSKNVLVVEGEWLTSGRQYYGIFFPNGYEVQEIFYSAPKAMFNQFFPDLFQVFPTIKWNEEENPLFTPSKES